MKHFLNVVFTGDARTNANKVSLISSRKWPWYRHRCKRKQKDHFFFLCLRWNKRMANVSFPRRFSKCFYHTNKTLFHSVKKRTVLYLNIYNVHIMEFFKCHNLCSRFFERGILVYDICIISISKSISDGATNQFWILKGHSTINSANEYGPDLLNTFDATRV